MKHIFILIFMLTACCSCVKESNNPLDSGIVSNRLSIETSVGDFPTRASTVSNLFVENDTVGIALYNTLSDIPYGENATPLGKAYVFNSGQWQSSEAFMLNEQKGTAYAYYPFTSRVNIDSIPLQLDQTDYLWGVSSQRNLSADKFDGTSTASITMDHLLTRILIKLYKSSYPKAVVTGIRVRSKGKSILSNESKGVSFSARTGKIAGIRRDAGTEIVFTDDDAKPIKDLELTEELPISPTVSAIILPTGAFDNGELEFVVTVNNKDFVVPVPRPSSGEYTDASGGWNQRFSYTYSMVFTGVNMSISNVSLIPWVMLPHQNINVDINNPYKYSRDRTFCWYKKQENMRVLPCDSTQVTFVMYSNQNIDSKTISATYVKQGVIKSVDVVKSDMGNNDYTNGEKTLGQWRYNINIYLTPNRPSSEERRDTIWMRRDNAPFAAVPLLHQKP